MVPTTTQFRSENGENGEGSSSAASKTFQTIIYPTQDAIEISTEFVQQWTNVISEERYGSIRDPAGNFFGIDTSTIMNENCIKAGIIVSQYCGFHEPQKVIFDYQPNLNQFNMRIIDDEGKDIPYYGFHYPINEHAKKVADPNYEVNPGFIFTYKDDEDMYIPLGFGMEHMNISETMLEARQNPQLLADMYPFEWFCDVSKAISKGKSVMHFPKAISTDANLDAVHDIVVINEETDQVIRCNIKKSNRIPPEYSIGGGWYAFVKNLKLKIGDKLGFGMDNPPTHIQVIALRARVAYRNQ